MPAEPRDAKEKLVRFKPAPAFKIQDAAIALYLFCT